jgi:hypothetical protein
VAGHVLGWRPSAKRACRCTQPAPVRHMTRCVSPASWGGSTPTTGKQSHAGSRGRRGPGHRRVRLRRDPGRGPRRHPRLPVPVRRLAPARATHSHPAVCRPSHSARVTAARGRLSPDLRIVALRRATSPGQSAGQAGNTSGTTTGWCACTQPGNRTPGGRATVGLVFRERWLGTLISAGRAWRFTGSDLGDRGLR